MSPIAPGIVPECSGASRVKRAARAGFAALDACAFYLFIRQPMGRKSALRREIPWILRGFQGLLSC